jgi:DNA helicase-2/ATP-dependent DNA helicase PcrA
MSEHHPFEQSEITNEEIDWASDLLNLPALAFYGEDGADPRQAILKSWESIDVAACPGSGKTTLLVAKLAILAEKWRSRTRGICVVSHTNVARNEIETRLGNTTAGRRLLSYPHFIGTIHGFVNDFLAVPWLRSRGLPIKMIDTTTCEAQRWNKLPHNSRVYLRKNGVDESSIRILDSGFNLEKKKGQFPFGHHTSTYEVLKSACEETARDGYHCYDDMFIWAGSLMDKVPGIVEVIRDRFPILFVDEAQDNREDQSAILHRIFRAGNGPVIRQRFGDNNQAIFDSTNASEATTDIFPNVAIEKDLPNSYRFGQTIANIADPLGLIPHGLKGQGPAKKFLASGAQEGRHTLFLFENDGARRVLDAYGELLLETFSEQEIREGTFTAIGQVHRRPDGIEEIHKFPQHVGHYWPNYDPELANRDPKPRTLVQYVFAGMAKAESTGESYFLVEKITEGILRLGGMVDSERTFPRRKGRHRYILELLREHPDVRALYDELIASFAIKRESPMKEAWNGHWSVVARSIAETVGGAPLSSPEAARFLEWEDKSAVTASTPLGRTTRDNFYRYCGGGKREVAIRVGSIHSVKGETHTATLVMETFWNRHNLSSLLGWLCGENSGRPNSGVEQPIRLRIHYVAMTRATHLLCLAMKRVDQNVVQKLEQRGWHVKSI